MPRKEHSRRSNWFRQQQISTLTTTARVLIGLLFLLHMNIMARAFSANGEAPRVAIIGAGAGGLGAARVVSRAGMQPVVLEKDPQPGGVWRYQSGAKDRPMYRGLRTNLPKELMAFREHPFDKNIPASFVTHQQVQDYLLDYKNYFGLDKFIQYDCRVEHLSLNREQQSAISPDSEEWPTFRIKWTSHGEESCEETFDAVMVCNGHYAAPSSPQIPGVAQYFHGSILHSIEYDAPEDFKDKTVLCIGGRASGADLAREISHHAKHVFLSDSTCSAARQDGKVTLVPRTTSVDSEGKIQFDLECPIQPSDVDTIIFCSGYDYQFPFLDSMSGLEFRAAPGERRVTPLYEQLWHAECPSLTFIGLPHSVVPFPLFELQAEAIVAQWDNCQLPGREERMNSAAEDAAAGGPNPNGRIQDTHFLGGFQWDYCRKMAQLADILDDRLDAYIRVNQELYDHAGSARKSESPGGPDNYRSIRYERPSWDQWKVLDEPLGAGSRSRGSGARALQ